MELVKVGDKLFQSWISEAALKERIKELAQELNENYKGKDVVFITILKGAFIFMADLVREVDFDPEMRFMRLSSYDGGMTSSGDVKVLLGDNESIEGKDILIVEDIVDTGNTINFLRDYFSKEKPLSIKVVSLLFKEEVFKGDPKPEFVGFNISNDFVVGYGLDYGERARSLKGIYKLYQQDKLSGNMLNVVLYGAPGAGKGTQAKNVIQNYGLVHLSTGDILRAERSKGTELGNKVAEIMDAGKYVSDEIVIEIIRNRITEEKNALGFIFDGFPRTVAQAQALDQLLADLGTGITTVISLEVPQDELTRRLLKRAKEQGRGDDNEESIRHRVIEHETKAKKVGGFYEVQGKLMGVDGMGGIDEIFNRIQKVLDTKVEPINR